MREKTVNFKLVTSANSEEGRVYLRAWSVQYKTDVFCRRSNFESGVLVKRTDPNHKYKNARLAYLKEQAEILLATPGITKEQFYNGLFQIIDPIAFDEKKKEEEKAKKILFERCINECIEKANKPKTKKIYAHTRSLVFEYMADNQLGCDPAMTDIDLDWLESFEQWMTNRGLKVNGISIHMRNLRAVCNYAIKRNYITDYAFRNYKIRKEQTAKRCLTVEQLRELRDFPCLEYQERYRDIFMLMFYLRGVNPVDLLNAERESVVDGRFEYRRCKTGHLFSIKIEPEAQVILDKYAGERLLLNVAEKNTWETFMQHMNIELKKIGATEIGKHGKKLGITPICSQLSAYWSRHTWATMAAEIDIPKDTIGKALGHEWACVTDTYIKFNEKKVDEASRKVIDYLNGTFKTQEQWQEELRLQQEAAAAEQKRLLEESQRKQDELLEANRQMQQQLLTLMQQMVFK